MYTLFCFHQIKIKLFFNLYLTLLSHLLMNFKLLKNHNALIRLRVQIYNYAVKMHNELSRKRNLSGSLFFVILLKL